MLGPPRKTELEPSRENTRHLSRENPKQPAFENRSPKIKGQNKMQQSFAKEAKLNSEAETEPRQQKREKRNRDN